MRLHAFSDRRRSEKRNAGAGPPNVQAGADAGTVAVSRSRFRA